MATMSLDKALEKKNPDLVVSGLHSGHVKIWFFRLQPIGIHGHQVLGNQCL
jgi:hypothetical protein